MTRGQNVKSNRKKDGWANIEISLSNCECAFAAEFY